MRTHCLLAAAMIAVFLLCVGTAFAGTHAAKGSDDNEAVEPGAMPRERARIMGYGPDDPRAAADARRNLGGNDVADNDVKAKKEERRKAKAAKRR